VKWHKGAADTPLVCERYLFENHSQDARYKGPLDVCPMLSAQMGTGGNNQPLVLCMARGQANAEILEDKSPCLNCNHEQPIACFQNTGIGWWNESDVGATIRTPCGGDSTLANVVVETRPVRYIVRRLTPTECARLQGFADRWGDIESKTEFSDEEYRFWLEVRNTHATVIGGKEAKEYTKEQMLTWYNKLHTDSAEYKLWGNGIALPPALYCLQGITDALNA
jgi:DNA (cytosine-5)-methyltransferase 1